MGNNSSSSSSSSLPINTKQLEPGQRIALFAQYLEQFRHNNNNNTKSTNTNSAFFWTCQVTDANKNGDDDIEVECAIGVPSLSTINSQEEKEIIEQIPPSSSIKMWLKKDHNVLYRLQKATKEDEERRFFSIFPPNDKRLRKIWINEETGKLNLQMPKGLFESGVQVGPHEEDIEFFKSMRDPKEVDSAVSPKNGWRGKDTFAFQLYDFIVVEAAMRRSMEDLKN